MSNFGLHRSTRRDHELYAAELGDEAFERQRREAAERLSCCGELRDEGHHRECPLWKPPHVDGQESLL